MTRVSQLALEEMEEIQDTDREPGAWSYATELAMEVLITPVCMNSQVSLKALTECFRFADGFWLRVVDYVSPVIHLLMLAGGGGSSPYEDNDEETLWQWLESIRPKTDDKDYQAKFADFTQLELRLTDLTKQGMHPTATKWYTWNPLVRYQMADLNAQLTGTDRLQAFLQIWDSMSPSKLAAEYGLLKVSEAGGDFADAVVEKCVAYLLTVERHTVGPVPKALGNLTSADHLNGFMHRKGLTLTQIATVCAKRLDANRLRRVLLSFVPQNLDVADKTVDIVIGEVFRAHQEEFVENQVRRISSSLQQLANVNDPEDVTKIELQIKQILLDLAAEDVDEASLKPELQRVIATARGFVKVGATKEDQYKSLLHLQAAETDLLREQLREAEILTNDIRLIAFLAAYRAEKALKNRIKYLMLHEVINDKSIGILEPARKGQPPQLRQVELIDIHNWGTWQTAVVAQYYKEDLLSNKDDIEVLDELCRELNDLRRRTVHLHKVRLDEVRDFVQAADKVLVALGDTPTGVYPLVLRLAMKAASSTASTM